MPDILLATLNAKFIHAAFGLRYLLANMGDLGPRTGLIEFDINQKPVDIAEIILAQNPRIVGLGVYIWNVTLTTELVGMLKCARPELVIILGGPEVSFETDRQEIIRLADHTITGEADLKFAEVCRELLAGASLPKVIAAGLPDLAKLELPYDLYDERDAAHRVIYVEASRGCPFTCEFCLSSLDLPVRQFSLDRFLASMQRLLDRGVKQFKFVDRTFNLHLPTSTAILRFFLERWSPGLFVHFEMVPDRLPEQLRELIAQFPPGGLQFEVGIQTFNPEVEQLISRRQNHERLADNFRWLREHSGVHVHADLIVGLPGESLASFATGFDHLIGLRPQEIQVGILKRLRGTPIMRHDREWAMVYSPQPPYEILQTQLLDFATLGRLRRFAKFWDLFGNSGNFTETLPWLWRDGRSAFVEILSFSDWLHARGVKTSGIALARQYELLWEYLTTAAGLAPTEVASVLGCDYQRGGRKDQPAWLRECLPQSTGRLPEPPSALPKRQARHAAVTMSAKAEASPLP
jgi:radical SAM superfamily enzyme YgiQ (UPF0313 family)